MEKHSPAQTINHEHSVKDVGGATPQLFGNLAGAALRYDGWPSLNGNVNFGFNWSVIHANSHVYISASEIDNAGNRFMGAAPYTVQNVVVKEGRVEFKIAIGWNSPLRVSTDILVVNP
ncbi:MAG: hypothetical protein ACRESZ_20995 [Methylococcales bacterium]